MIVPLSRSQRRRRLMGRIVNVAMVVLVAAATLVWAFNEADRWETRLEAQAKRWTK
jgi:hypothetical protein